jgi:alpha-galactosidase
VTNIADPTPTSTELQSVAKWFEHLFGLDGCVPVTFKLGSAFSATILHLDSSETGSFEGGSERILRWTSVDGLTLRCTARLYAEYPLAEWTAHLVNEGESATEIITEFRGLDVVSYYSSEDEILLRHNVGSPCRADDYAPLQTTLAPDSITRIATTGGRSSNSDLPYFAVDMVESHALFAIGWPGQWEATFERDGDSLGIVAKQEDTHFRLYPGEDVRAPRIAVLLADTGTDSDVSSVRAQNMWRRWMLAHVMPKPSGQDLEPQLTPCSSHQYGEMIHADEASQIMFVDRYQEEGLAPDYWWMDAGWYTNESGWPNTGTWEVDTLRFPNGLRAVSDHAHDRDIRIIVWFEPERVTPGTELWTEHADWLMVHPDDLEHQRLLDLGNPAAREWLTDRVDRLITEQGIDLYRQDFNMDPLPYWRAADAPDRIGISENGYVTGLLAYWDELLHRHPDMLIDECASGGRRNDIEMLSRSVPLLRSDFIMEATAQQCHTYGISSWIPYHGTGADATDEYGARSQFALNIIGCWDLRRKDLDYDLIRRLMSEWRDYAPLMLGDFYPLTEYHLGNDVWMAWQFDRPDLDRGMVNVFRRPDSPYEQARFQLEGLDRSAQYRLRDLNGNDGEVEMSGEQLLDDGLPILIEERSASRIILYNRVQ